MDALEASLDESEAVMTRVDVEEIGLEGLERIVAEAKAHHVGTERDQSIHV